MSYAIVKVATSGSRLGIQEVALVDRSKSRLRWWTSDDPDIIMRFDKKSAAHFVARRLRYGNVSVVPFEEAVEIITDQASELSEQDDFLSDDAAYGGLCDT